MLQHRQYYDNIRQYFDVVLFFSTLAPFENTGEPVGLNFSHFGAFKGRLTQEFSHIIYYIRIINYFKFRKNVAK